MCVPVFPPARLPARGRVGLSVGRSVFPSVPVRLCEGLLEGLGQDFAFRVWGLVVRWGS